MPPPHAVGRSPPRMVSAAIARVTTAAASCEHGSMGDTAVGECPDMKLPVMPPVAPMLAKPVAAIPPGQFYEPKWDGFRAIVFRDGGEGEVGSREVGAKERLVA